MAHVGVEPVPRAGSSCVHGDPQRPQRRRRSGPTPWPTCTSSRAGARVEAARNAYDWLQERLAATQAEHARGAGQALQELPEPGPLRARGQRLRGDAPRSPSSTRTTSQAQARRIAIEAALKQVDADARARARAWTRSPRWRPTRGRRPEQPDRRAHRRPLAPAREVQGRPPRGAEGPGPGRPDPQGARTRAPTQIVAGLQAEYAQLQKREAELHAAIDGQKAQAASQSRKARELEALKKEAESAKNLYEVLLQKLNETRHRGLHPQQQRDGRGAGDAAALAGAARQEARSRASRPRPRPARWASVSCSAATTSTTRSKRPRGGRALPAPRPPGRGAPLRRGQRPPRHRGLPEPAHRPALRAQGRARPGRAHHRHRAPGGQDHHAREHRQAPGRRRERRRWCSTATSAAPSSTSRLGLAREPGLTDYFVRHEDLDSADPAHATCRTSSR